MVDISVVIPVYNIENYLNDCLDSILSQTFQNFEVICVNDGSKDNSLKILQHYAVNDNRFIIIDKENGGSGSARNAGLEIARGKYVQFLDGDDYFEPQMFEKLFNIAEKFEADIAVCSSRKVDNEKNIIESRNPLSPLELDKIVFNKPFNHKDYPNDIFNLIGAVPWNKLYLREMLIKNNLKFPTLTGPDDLCFVYCANIFAKKIVAIDDEFINYRFDRPGSVYTYRANHAIDIIKASLYLKSMLEKNNLFEFLKNAYFNAIFPSIRWELSLCNDDQYKTFLTQLKNQYPNDWKFFTPALSRDYIDLKYLNNYIGNNKVYLWGASNFLRNILKNERKINSNILGVIDKNNASWGKNFGNYKIYSPEILKINPADILVTIYNKNEQAHMSITNELSTIHPKIKVLPNIFENESFAPKID